MSSDGSVVVGDSVIPLSQRNAFRWTSAGGIVSLGTLGGSSSRAHSVSADGSVVVGWADTLSSVPNAFRWTSAGGMVSLGTLGGGTSYANGVSADGSVVVGDSPLPSGDANAFRWTSAGGMVNLGTLGGALSTAYAVNSDGSVVVGTSCNSNGDKSAFRWTSAGGMVSLGTLGGNSSHANAVSADGSIVVGATDASNGDMNAFRWTSAGGMVNLGTLGGNYSDVFDVSSDGSVVVGWSTIDSSTHLHAVRWTTGTAWQPIKDILTANGENLTGWSLQRADAVSADGTIIAGTGGTTDAPGWIANIPVNAFALLDLQGVDRSLGSLLWGGTVTNSGSGSPATFTVGSDNTSTTFIGTLQDGTSTTALTKIGTGALTLSGANAFSGPTNIGAGTLSGGATNALSANSAVTVASIAFLDLGGFGQTIGSLAGAGTVTNSGVSSPATLTAGGDNSSTAFSGVLQDGTSTTALTKIGTGTLTLSGASTYSGATTVNAGTLSVNGDISSSSGVTVHNGGTLGGTGTLGGLTVGNGGTLAPGNSIGTLTVNGAFTLGAGAIYEVEVNAGGQSDRVVVNGTVNLTGATLSVLAANGDYDTTTDYLLIENDGTDAVTGTFAAITSNLAFLDLSVIYNGGTGNDVVLAVERNETMFDDEAETPNQEAVAGPLDGFPTDDALFLAVLNQTAAGARQAFDALSGELHATVGGVLADDSRYVRDAILGRLMQAGHDDGSLGAAGPQVASLDQAAMALGYDDKSLAPPPSAPVAFWTAAYGAWGDYDGNGNAATADRDLGGFVSGMDASLGSTWRIGLAAGASYSSIDVNDRNSSADVESFNLAGYAGGMVGAFALRGGGGWAWNEIDTSRAVIFPGFFERQSASYDADTGQIFGEVAYPTNMGAMSVEPFAGLAYVSVDTDSFVERGGALASLTSSATDQNVGYSTLGFRAATTTQWGSTMVTPHLSAAWQHAFNDVTPGAALAFASNGIGFNVTGVPLAEDSALIDAGLDFALAENLNAGVSYSGQFGDGVQDNAVKGRFTWLF